MRRLPLRAASTFAAAATAVSILGVAAPAFAKTVPVDTPPLDCFGDFGDLSIVSQLQPGQVLNYAGSAGCVAVQVSAAGQQFGWAVTAPGWSYVVKNNGGGTKSRVELRFTNATTNQKVDFRYESGRVVIG